MNVLAYRIKSGYFKNIKHLLRSPFRLKYTCHNSRSPNQVLNYKYNTIYCVYKNNIFIIPSLFHSVYHEGLSHCGHSSLTGWFW